MMGLALPVCTCWRDGPAVATNCVFCCARAQAGALTERDLAELKSYNAPHPHVRLVMMALCALFCVPTDWKSAQRLLVRACVRAARAGVPARLCDTQHGVLVPHFTHF